MKMTMRWYGHDDPVTLSHIRQIPGVTGIVSAIYDIPVGDVWPLERILKLKKDIEDAGLELSVIESVPVHEDIKMGRGNRDLFIKNYAETLKNLSKAGIDCVCYNFMPVFDWTRTELIHQNKDGSNSLAYVHDTAMAMDPVKGDLTLPGWDASYTKDQMKDLLLTYADITEEDLWSNLKYFLEGIMPTAEECKVKMAIHPDDPPFSIFGLPRVITSKENLKRFLNLYDSPYNGLTLCTGSLGVSADNDIIDMINSFHDRIHFAHIRNIKRENTFDFVETGHKTECGSLDIYGIVKAYCDNDWDGYVRPDHGRMIWGEEGRFGYGLFDRALGATYLNGLFEALSKNK